MRTSEKITKQELLSIFENVDDNSFIEFETIYLGNDLASDSFLSQTVNWMKRKKITLIRIEEEL